MLPDAAELARELKAGGATLRAIADVLAEHGHRTAAGGPLAPVQVSRLLSRS